MSEKSSRPKSPRSIFVDSTVTPLVIAYYSAAPCDRLQMEGHYRVGCAGGTGIAGVERVGASLGWGINARQGAHAPAS